jgi:hypothetical protein
MFTVRYGLGIYKQFMPVLLSKLKDWQQKPNVNINLFYSNRSETLEEISQL